MLNAEKRPDRKRSLVRLAAASGALAGLTMASPAAHADGSVALYGLISTGVQYVNNQGGASLFSVLNGTMQGPRFGLKGREELGGGTAAIFQLENGFNVLTGSASQGGRMFGRQAWVGLTNPGYGQLTIGRQYDELTQQVGMSEGANQFLSYGAHIGDNDNLFNTIRLQNSVRYKTADFGGFSAAAQYAFSNSTTGFSNNRAFSGGMSYANGPLWLGAAFSQFDHPYASTNTGGAVDGDFGFSSPFVTSPGGAGVARQRVFAFGGGYDFQIVKTTWNYSNVSFQYNDGTGLRLQNLEGVLSYNITPAWLVGGNYTYTWGNYSNGAKPKYHQIDLGTDYFLSKRTDVFLVAIWQRAVGDAKYAQIESLSPSSTRSQFASIAGIRHKF
ncbi:porin [Pandoraea cepalis]|uniref:Porin n=1 Tax=Pandoraea cepalis TaxID=2508294 RepID=A0AAW7MHN0_9BURK|nr:porin [Pandoraea cepalis]MDN4572259.1 porin [Pandoraea cepalis]MDN4576866.1 porin [Pandoraea cepalis]